MLAGSHPDIHAKLQRALRYLEEGIQTKRRIVEGMRPTILTQFGLAEALRYTAEEMAEVSGWTLRLTVEEDLPLSEELSLTLFRVAQEALNNAAKYSEAQCVEIILEADEHTVRLVIRDDGKGMELDAVHKPRSHGLAGMRSRVEARGGYFEIQGAPGRGVEISVSLALSQAE